MKMLICALVMAASWVGFAEPTNRVVPKLTEEQKKEAALKRLERSGGIVEKLGLGKLAVVNCQKKIPASEVGERADKIHRLFRITVETSERESWKIDMGVPEGAQAAIFVIDDPSLPMSIVAAEAHWGVVNAATLDSGARFSKQFSRVVTMTLGASLAMTRTSPMQPVSTAADLDKLLTDGFTMESVNAMTTNMKAIGITGGIKASYRKACIEGWAMMPTNVYQKAIWEEVHAKPTNPMKIKFDPKKGE